jgi:ATP-dependent 26S proteasome regulatory subunit
MTTKVTKLYQYKTDSLLVATVVTVVNTEDAVVQNSDKSLQIAKKVETIKHFELNGTVRVSGQFAYDGEVRIEGYLPVEHLASVQDLLTDLDYWKQIGSSTDEQN